MKKFILPLVFTFIIVSFYSCDKIDDPIENGVVNNPDDSTAKRRILIEEFTGQLCTYCPDGAREIERLVSVYGSQLIPVSIHAGSFADPNNGAPDDFRTADGNTYNTTFGVSSYPAAAVSRLNNAAISGKNQWETDIISIKDDAPMAEITISNTYNNSNRNVDISVDVEWLLDGNQSSNYKLQVYVIEDHIVAYQLDNGTGVNNYNHRHMLRGAVNGTWGDAITTTTAGTTENFSLSTTLNASWDENNCEIVAFIYIEGPDYEVIQANIEPVLPH